MLDFHFDANHSSTLCGIAWRFLGVGETELELRGSNA